MTINERLRELRFFVKKNQSDFASEIGLKQSHLSRIEKGTHEIPTVTWIKTKPPHTGRFEGFFCFISFILPIYRSSQLIIYIPEYVLYLYSSIKNNGTLTDSAHK